MSTHDEQAGGLTPEERALAQRLARLGPHAEPSSALDAKILAAAHAAAAPAPIRPRREQRRNVARWPTVLGFAASLALACGIAWQLRPLPNAPSSVRPTSTDDGTVEFHKTEPPSMSMQSVPPRKLQMPEAPPPEAPARAASRAVIRPPTQEERQEKPQAFVAPPIVLDEAVHPRQPAAAAAAAPAAPSPQEPGANAAADMQIVDIPPSASAPAMRERDAAAPAAKAAASAELGALQRAADQAERAREQAEPQYAEPDEEVVPPATTGNPEVRDAWLQRIRELQQAGQVEDARVSLKAFRKRYPEYIIPEDLRPLEK